MIRVIFSFSVYIVPLFLPMHLDLLARNQRVAMAPGDKRLDDNYPTRYDRARKRISLKTLEQ